MSKSFKGDGKKRQKELYKLERERRQGKRRIGDDEPREKRNERDDDDRGYNDRPRRY